MRCRGSFYNVLQNPNKQRASPISERLSTLKPQQRRNYFHKARTGKFNARQLVSVLDLPISVDHARRLLRNDENLRYVRIKKKPHMTAVHHAARLSWAEGFVTYTDIQIANVIWSDEKKI